MNATDFKQKLIALGACREAVDWAEGKSFEGAWNTSPRADWMLWLLGKIDGKASSRIIFASCACARTALKYIPVGEDRPRLAIETAELFVEGKATIKELESAEEAARAAWVAATAASASWAASAASSAAWVAASAPVSAAWAASHIKMAKTIRMNIPFDTIELT